MQISFKNTKLEKELTQQQKLVTTYGPNQAKKIALRMMELRAAATLYDFWPPYSGPPRCHELTGNKKGQLSVDIVHPYRLLFEPEHTPFPEREEGGLDWSQVTQIKITGIEDTHE